MVTTNSAASAGGGGGGTPTKKAPPGGGGGGGGGAPSPKSAFNGGKFSSPIGKAKKDYRYELFVRGVEEGIVVIYFKKPGRDEEPFLNHDYTFLTENPDVRIGLGVNAIWYRKGVDGHTAMHQNPTSNYSWRQLVCVVGEENTTQKRKSLADAIIVHFNDHATSSNYTFPKSIKFGSDTTGDGLSSVDEVLLDDNVVAMMQSAYPGIPVQSFVDYPDIMSNFWTDTDRGASVLMNFQEE